MKLNAGAECDVSLAALWRARKTSRAAVGYAWRSREVIFVAD